MPADPMQTHVVKSFVNETSLVACRFDPTGRFVFVGQQSEKVARWDLTTGTKTDFEGGHDSWVRAIAFVNKGDVVLTGGHDGRLVWWPTSATEKPAPIRKVDAHAGWIRAIDVSPDGLFIATCGNDLKVNLWKADDGSLVREFSGHERHVYNVAFHPGGKNLLSGDLVANFIDWEVETGKQIRSFKVATLHKYDPGFMADYGGPYSMQFSKDGKQFAAGGITNVSNAFAGVGNPALCMVDWESGKETMAHLAKSGVNGKVFGLALHPEGHLIGAVGGGGGGYLYFWKPGEKNEFHFFNIGNAVRDLTLHPDGIQLATAHHDKHLRLLAMRPKT